MLKHRVGVWSTRNHVTGIVAGLIGILGFLGTSAYAQDAFTLYDNLQNPRLATNGSGGNVYGVANFFAEQVGTNVITALIADDLNYTITDPRAFSVGSLSFTVLNGNNTDVTVRPLLRIWADDGPVRTNTNPLTSTPGTLLYAQDVTPVTMGARGTTGPTGFAQTVTVNLNFGALTLPYNSTKIWAGLSFDNANGTTGATLTQMNNIGQRMYGPAAIGSSADVVFSNTNAPAYNAGYQNAWNMDLPPGDPFQGGDLNAAYEASFGWKVTGFLVPEPSTLPLFCTGMISLYSFCRVRRQRAHR